MNQRYHMNLPPVSTTNTVLIALLAGFFLLTSFIPQSFGFFALSPILIKKGFIWELLTYPFANIGFMSMFFNALLLWFIGGEIEQTWGRKKYIKFILSIFLGTALLFLSLSFITNYSMPLYSMSSLIMALLVVYGNLYPERLLTIMLIIPVKAKYFCWILVGIQVYMTLLQGIDISSLSHLFGVILSLGFIFNEKRAFYKGHMQKKFKEKQRDHLKSQLKLIKNDDKPNYWN